MSGARKDFIRPLDFKRGCVDMNHGASGRISAQLVEELFGPAFDNKLLRQENDGALLPAPSAGHRLVMATDAHAISPLFFPGGDIGCLAVHGTINDVAMLGATPLYLSASFILEEGFALADLKLVVESMDARHAQLVYRSSPAIPMSSNAARAMVCSSAPAASACCHPGATSVALAPQRATLC